MFCGTTWGGGQGGHCNCPLILYRMVGSCAPTEMDGDSLLIIVSLLFFIWDSECLFVTDTHSTQWEDPRVIKLQNEQASVSFMLFSLL